MAGVKTLQAAIEAILFTMGESVELSKIAKAIEQDEQTTEELLQDLMKKYGIDAMHLVSAVEDLTGKKLGGCPPDRVAALQPAIRDYDCAAYLSDFTYLTQPYAGVCETLAELNPVASRTPF